MSRLNPGVLSFFHSFKSDFSKFSNFKREQKFEMYCKTLSMFLRKNRLVYKVEVSSFLLSVKSTKTETHVGKNWRLTKLQNPRATRVVLFRLLSKHLYYWIWIVHVLRVFYFSGQWKSDVVWITKLHLFYYGPFS